MNDIATQYRIITAGAGWIEKFDSGSRTPAGARSSTPGVELASAARGRLQFDGADRVAFLQALLTNDIASLAPGAGAYAAYLTPQGRMITDMHVFIREQSVVADVPAALAATLAETFDRLIFSEDVRVSEKSSALRQISVFGGRAVELLASALGLSVEQLRDLPTWSHLDIPAGGGFVARTDDLEEGSWDVILSSAAAVSTIAALESAGIVPASAALFEALRIDEGRPLFGVDMTTETIPLEAGLLDRAISQSKGCYVGQEVIIRVLHRGAGRVAKRLAKLTCDRPDASVPAAGSKVSVDGHDVGVVTSAAWSPRSGRVVALGYVSRETAEPGRTVSIEGSAATIKYVVGERQPAG